MHYDCKLTITNLSIDHGYRSIYLRAESEIVHQLDHLADSLDRSRNYLVNQALKEYLENQAWQIEKINQGLAAADRGELIEHDDVMREMEDLIASKAKGNA